MRTETAGLTHPVGQYQLLYVSDGEKTRKAALDSDVQPGSTPQFGGKPQAYAKAGRRADAERVLSQLLNRAKTSHVSPYAIAVVYAALDQRDEAFHWLDKALEERSKALIELRESFQFDNLRSDPRFANVLRRVGLPQ